MTTIHTVGHGTLHAEAFVALVAGAEIARVEDIRSFPGSRHNPQFGREELERWLPEAGVGYSWLRDQGGRRKSVPGSRHGALRNDAFRAYADHMETPAFRAGVEELLTAAGLESTAVMCSESVWWRCHRRLLADHLVLVEHVEVIHLMHDGRLTPHALTDGVRLEDDHLVYDVGTAAQLPLD
jgi:uncharacterized protein (DUF488 family)